MVGTTASAVSLYSELVLIFTEIFIGPVFDILGRKKAVVLFQLIAGTGFFLFPQFKSVFPGYFLCKLLANIGTVLTFDAPFLADYFHSQSTGQASSYIQMTQSVAQIISYSVIPYVNILLNDIKWVFYMLAILMYICAFQISFGLKEIVSKVSAPENNFSKPVHEDKISQKLVRICKIVWFELANEVQYTLAILSIITGKLTVVTVNQFSPIYVTSTYQTSYQITSDEASKLAQHDLSIYNLVGPIIALALCLIAGPIADKYKIYKLMLGQYSLSIFAGVLFLLDMNMNYQLKIGQLFWVGYILLQCIYNITLLLGFTLLAKVCNSQTRGTIFGFNALASSIVIALQNFVAEKTFEINNMVPFEIAFGCYLVLILLILILNKRGLLNK